MPAEAACLTCEHVCLSTQTWYAVGERRDRHWIGKPWRFHANKERSKSVQEKDRQYTPFGVFAVTCLTAITRERREEAKEKSNGHWGEKRRGEREKKNCRKESSKEGLSTEGLKPSPFLFFKVPAKNNTQLHRHTPDSLD